uniref:Integrase catalytic domain-containing protein n=1 Tax=Fagus sylvatica TaxID=28930 RepID=A0A2N9FB78_FAGSY
MSAYLTIARTLLTEFDSTHVAQIGREHNSHADILTKLAMALETDMQRTVCIETLDRPSFQNHEVSVYCISSQPSWMDPILNYLKDNKLPEDKKEAKMIKRICGSHTGGRSLAHRAISQGYWWPYMQADALKYVRECDKCQRLFKGLYSELGIRNFFSSPGYPQSNGQAEVSNKVILSGIKKKLETAKGNWVEELPSVLWTHRTTVRKSTGETPFALAFGVEVVIPLEVGMPTTRMTEFVVETNEENLRRDLDLLEERRDLAMVRLASYQQRMKREHDKNIKQRVFRVGELVLRKVMANTRKPNEGKIEPN